MDAKQIVACFPHFTKEALREQDGKKVPLTLENGGPVIGEVTLKYSENDAVLEAHLKITDPKVEAFLKTSAGMDMFSLKPDKNA